ncbi:MAG TPA: hypothetical protein VFG04_13000, partial [Planctomycetaceae bacterium]|nr:hypothetical protein [Planctomycetaceae bacterium]
VNRALELLDQLGHVTLAPAARISTAELLSKLDFLMGLRFAEKTRGKRRSFVPVGGIITIGDADSPIRKKHVNGVRPPVADGDSGGRIPAAIGDNMPACGSESRRHEDSCMGKGAVGSTPATPTGRCAFKA